MPPAPRLDEAMGVGRRGFRPEAHQSRHASSNIDKAPRGTVLRTYRWSQFHGREEVTEFDEAHFAAEGVFQQNSSEGHKEYQDRLRTIHLRKEGRQKADIAQAIGRSERFVAKWWQKDEKEIPRPLGVHAYLTKTMGRNERDVGATNGASMTKDSVSDTATWWRDVEVRRKFVDDPEIYEEILQNTEWKASNARTRDFATGAYHLKYDQRGNIRWEGHQGGKYKQGLSPAMDKGIQKLFAEYGIVDRTSGIITNWYPDGQGNLGSHRHDCWTALFSFGHERILTIDNTPLLMQDGDLVIFGTQRHGVPIMPEITEGRITLVVFFYPDKMQKQGMWQTITDPETMAPSRPLAKMLREHELGTSAQHDEGNEKALLSLQQLGFSRGDAEAALLAAGGTDVERAAEFLIMAGRSTDCTGDVLKQDTSNSVFENTSCNHLCVEQVTIKPVEQTSRRPGRFHRRALAMAVSTEPFPGPGIEDDAVCQGSSCASAGSVSTAAASSTSSTCPAGTASNASSAAEESDEAMARRLQLEEDRWEGKIDLLGSGVTQGMNGGMSDQEVAALALQLDELEGRAMGPDPALLAAQFHEYEAAFTMEDAESWNGHGDLMHSPFSREHLSIDKMEKATIYSVGHGDMLERDFWEMLQCHSIRVLYDVRQTNYRGELHVRHQRFSVASLRAQCRARGIFYKPMPLGRESAYGTLAHIKTDEGQHTLVELAWQAKRKRTAFLGCEEHWQDDPRQVAAEELAKAGHFVEHVRSDGSTERHLIGIEFPDWLTREEKRLKLLEKKREAGEMVRPEKSRSDRSSEVVAARLSQPAEEIDAMEALQGAANQREFIVAQRKLARYQRLAEQKGVLAAKVVKNMPEWIAEDARRQAEWVAAKKKDKERAATPASTNTAEDADVQKAASLSSPSSGVAAASSPPVFDATVPDAFSDAPPATASNGGMTGGSPAMATREAGGGEQGGSLTVGDSSETAVAQATVMTGAGEAAAEATATAAATATASAATGWRGRRRAAAAAAAAEAVSSAA